MSDDLLLAAVCDTVAEGSSPLVVAKAFKIPYHKLIRWLYATQERSDAYTRALAARAEWEIERILQELRRVGLVDIREAFTPDGALKPIHEIPQEVAAAIVGIEVEELWSGVGKDRGSVGRLKKIKFSDKLKAIELIGKKLHLFAERHEITGRVSLEQLVAEAGKAPSPAGTNAV